MTGGLHTEQAQALLDYAQRMRDAAESQGHGGDNVKLSEPEVTPVVEALLRRLSELEQAVDTPPTAYVLFWDTQQDIDGYETLGHPIIGELALHEATPVAIPAGTRFVSIRIARAALSNSSDRVPAVATEEAQSSSQLSHNEAGGDSDE